VLLAAGVTASCRRSRASR